MSLDRETALSFSLGEWSYLDKSLIWVYNDSIPSTANKDKRNAPYHSCWYLNRGTVTVTTENETCSAQAGEWMVPPVGIGRKQVFSSDAHILSIYFKANWPDGTQVFSKGLPVVLSDKEYPELLQRGKALSDLVVEAKLSKNLTTMRGASVSIDTFVQIERLFNDWFLVWYRTLVDIGLFPTRVSDMDDRVRLVMSIIDDLPLVKEFPKDELMLQTGLSLGQIDRLFRECLGFTSNSYYQHRRLLCARQLLKASDKTIKEIAFALGFSSVSHFSTWFSKRAGTNPQEYRERMFAYKE